ncbi:ABC transporter substrate-binding protein [Rhodobaculum claviforme]|uniref:Peptide transporter subunit: periplasmic-binding component of ABC superfamily n=1 Tax=Rhodobaculum claviforme TaxID=1549854 RepID=A0A934TN46_9RHOB|nr:ABC transporter substrate-binding protein [Rhodobaculum claviforme]MBK5928644.1 peptide transporter subunit: periplasmic-binding component of ABC superfamily [Rhodobaculum claviforme]
MTKLPVKKFLVALAATTALTTGAAWAEGTVRVALGTSLNQLDPALTTIGDEYVYVHLVFNGLTKLTPDLVVEPDLAERWDISNDLMTWTFHLRDDVTFHHGRALEAADVVATVERILDEGFGSRARTNLGMVETVAAIDARTVEFTLNAPYSGFADIFADRQMRIVPHDRLDDLSNAPVGTGPFRFVSWSPGDRLELVANPDYFIDGKPSLDGVTLRIIPEAAARVAALESDSIDILWNLPYEQVERFADHDTIRVDAVATATWDGVILNNTTPPFEDERVRRALAMTIDKAALVELAIFGQGAPTHSPIPPSHPFFNDALEFAAPDIEGARALLAEAGYPDGFTIPMQVPQEREQRVRMGVAVRDMARQAGINIDIERVPFASYAANVAGQAPIYVDGYFARPTLDTALHPFFHSQGSWNHRLWNYSNERADEILDRARETRDESELEELFKELQAVLDETVPGIIAYSMAHVNGVNRRVEGFRSTPMMWLELADVSMAE